MNPPRALQPLNGAKPRKFAHSDRFVLPRITAPAARSRLTIGASAGTLLLTSASEPAVVCMLSAVAMLSLTRIGIPCSGPRSWPFRRSRSRCTAMAIALGLVSITAPSNGFSDAMRARYPAVRSRLVRRPLFISACNCGIVASRKDGGCGGAAVSRDSGENAPPITAAPVASPPPTNRRRVIAMMILSAPRSGHNERLVSIPTSLRKEPLEQWVKGRPTALFDRLLPHCSNGSSWEIGSWELTCRERRTTPVPPLPYRGCLRTAPV